MSYADLSAAARALNADPSQVGVLFDALDWDARSRMAKHAIDQRGPIGPLPVGALAVLTHILNAFNIGLLVERDGAVVVYAHPAKGRTG